jgi:hypothetical protein
MQSGSRGRDHMVVWFTTTYAISDLQQVGGFLRVLRVSSINRTDRHDIAEILLKLKC